MKTTIDLLNRAMLGAKSERQLSQDLGLYPTAITTARTRGNLSPAIAAKLAERLGEDVATWMARAVLEAAHGTQARTLKRTMKEAQLL
jgi:plasmid maintenance system antidote protein VapI